MSSKPTPEPNRVTIYGKRVERVELRGNKHYAVFEDGTDLAISAEAHERISERLRASAINNSAAKSEPPTSTLG